jgi:hypothetical protein
MVLYVCETWSLTLREELLRRKFVLKKKEVMGECSKLSNEELRRFVLIVNYKYQVEVRYADHVAQMGEKTNVYRVLAGKAEGKRPLGRPTCRWMDKIWIGLEQIGWGGVGWVSLAEDRDKWRAFVNAVINLRFL